MDGKKRWLGSRGCTPGLLAGSLGLGLILAFGNTALAQTKPHPAEDLERLARKADGILSVLQETVQEIPGDTFDLPAIVDRAGANPGRLFQWVRDNTSLVPYVGALRGPRGVLMDRLGNSLDRSLLLSELLRLAGVRTRIVGGSLSEEQAQRLLDRCRVLPGQRT